MNFSVDEDVEVEMVEEEAAFLKGYGRRGMDMSPVRIVKNPDGSLQQAALMQGALMKERREMKQQKLRAEVRLKLLFTRFLFLLFNRFLLFLPKPSQENSFRIIPPLEFIFNFNYNSDNLIPNLLILSIMILFSHPMHWRQILL